MEPYVNWTHLLVFEDGNGYKLPDRSRDSLSAGLVFGSRETGLTASLDATYYGTQYAVDRESGSSAVQSQEKLDNVGDAWVIDFSCSQRLVKFQNENEIRLKGSIHNLFDEFYSTDEDDWMPGRSLYLGLEYRL
jgi:vitamin B12 transporter